MIIKAAYILDLALLAFAFGATTWFFFVQTPVLLRWKGKEKFIPIQMKLTKTLFATLAIVVPVMFGMTLVHGHEALWLHVATAGLAMLAALCNAFVVVPRALRAGGRSMREVRSGDGETTLGDFASRGAGEAAKVWHRLVVLLVVAMLAGLAAHGAVLLGHEGPHEIAHVHAAHADHSDPTIESRWTADAKTTEHVHAMTELAASSGEMTDEHTALLRQRYQQIFTDCTMTGDAHNALHGFLLPVGELLDAAESASPTERARVIKELHDHLLTYDRTFH